MATHDIITVGASAGGIETLKRLLGMLPNDLPASLLIVQHLHPRFGSTLPAILERAGPLPTRFATDGVLIEPGHVYLAPPDFHLLVSDGRLRVEHGPKENRHRPAIDPLFRSAAWTYGPRVVGVVLSGTLDDGAAGLWAVKSCGGVTVVQDPGDALYSEMPTSALMTLNVDYCQPLAEIAELLTRLAGEPVDLARAPERPAKIGKEAGAVTMDQDTDVEHMQGIGKPSGFACPTCHGALWELNDGELVRYRCHIGHAFGPDSLLAAQNDDIEIALESALRALEEKASAARRLRDRMGERMPGLASRYDAQAAGVDAQVALIRKILRWPPAPSD